MENEKSESATTHEIEGLGAIRAHNGTALETIAGAASYWQKQAVSLADESRTKWRDGFLTGSISTAVITIVVSVLLRYLS